MKVVYKVPFEQAKVIDIPLDLKSLQNHVDGLITYTYAPNLPGIDIVCNDEAILLQMPPNVSYMYNQHPTVLFGPVLFVSHQGDETIGLTDKQIESVFSWLRGY